MKNIIIVFSVLLLISCSKDEIMKFGLDAAIRFLGDAEVNQAFLFHKSDYVRDTVWLQVQTSGDVSDRERSFVIEQLYEYPELTYIKDEHGNILDSIIDAKPGVHYEALNSGETFELSKISPGFVSAKVPIILIRNADLQHTVYRIALTLIPNNEFSTDFIEDMIVRKIFFTDLPIKPNNWDTTTGVIYLWGEYSEVKYRFIIDVIQEE
ncbi:MAG: DUF4843 domain-containing protein, partial [Odoribacter sp.]|nr:DUF4843 domain-containing protein [Odoribacter sp.]